MDAHEIARKVRAWRLRRGMTQQQFADALGRHVSWVKKFESGDRQADPRVTLLIDMARVLDVPLDAFVRTERAGPDDHGGEQATITELRAALLQPARDPHDSEAQLARRIAYGYDAYQASDYRTLGRLLPTLITDARATANACPGDPAAGYALAESCHLAAITLMKLGDPMAAWNAADRALTTAETINDAVTVALCAQALTWAAAGVGQGKAGVAVAHAVLDKHGAELAARGDEEGWTALGMMQLKAAVAAAGAGDPSQTRDMIALARRSAEHVRADANVRRTGFNATNVLLYEASAAAVLGDHPAALAAAARIHPDALAALPRERRTHHLIDTADSALAAGHTSLALEMLLRAEQTSPQEVRSLPAARAVIAGLAHARRGPAGQSELRELARRAGVAV